MPYMDKNDNTCGFLDIEERESSNVFSRRFFILDRRKGALECYMDNPLNLAPHSEPVHKFNLPYISIVGDAKRLKPKEPFSFYFTFAGKNICLRADGCPDKEQWIELLKEAAKVVVANKGSSRSPSVEGGASRGKSNSTSTSEGDNASSSYQVEVFGDVILKTELQRSASDGDMTELRCNRGNHSCTARSWDPYCDQHQVLKCGYGVKQGQIRKNWKRRYFTLTPISFSYYKDEEEREPIKVIALADVIEARVSVGIHLNKEHVFEVVTGQRVYYVQTETAGERDAWISAVNMGVEKLRKPRRRHHEAQSQTDDSLLALYRYNSLPDNTCSDSTSNNNSVPSNQHSKPCDVHRSHCKAGVCDCAEKPRSSVLCVRL